MFLSTEKFILLILLASGVPVFLIALVSYLLYKQNNAKKLEEVKLLNAILLSQEEEQNRIAQDLHDQIGPELSSIKMLISYSNDSLSMKQIHNLNLAKSMLDKLVTEIRTISHNLKSSRIAEIGLSTSLHEIASHFNNSPFQIYLDIHIDDLQLSYQQQVNIYRICLELISNSVTHSNGNRIDLCLHPFKNFLQMEYTDNGSSNNYYKQDGGAGLANIKNRIKLLDSRIFYFTDNFKLGAHYIFHFRI